MIPTTLRLPPELRAKLDHLAKSDGRTFSAYVARVLARHVMNAEDEAARAKSRKGKS